MFAILTPFAVCPLIITLLYYQHKAKRFAPVSSSPTTFLKFCSDIDLGGIILFVSGLALFLLPITIAASLSHGWKTPWVTPLIVVGFLVLVALMIYEKKVAISPLLPLSYFQKPLIVLSMILLALDEVGRSVTHRYLFAWATIAHNMSARDTTFYV